MTDKSKIYQANQFKASKMLTKLEYNRASEYEMFIINQLRLKIQLTDSETVFLERWSARLDALHHSTVCLIDREIQRALSFPKGSAYFYNCEVIHHIRDYRGLPSVNLQDEDQWDDSINQPKIAASDIRYRSDVNRHPQPTIIIKPGIKRKAVSSLAAAAKQRRVISNIKSSRTNRRPPIRNAKSTQVSSSLPPPGSSNRTNTQPHLNWGPAS